VPATAWQAPGLRLGFLLHKTLHSRHRSFTVPGQTDGAVFLNLNKEQP